MNYLMIQLEDSSKKEKKEILAHCLIMGLNLHALFCTKREPRGPPVGSCSLSFTGMLVVVS